MADFTPKTAVKSAVRNLSAPIETLAGIGTVIDGVLVDNPFQCTAYQSGGENRPGAERAKKYYSGTIVYENNEGKKVGSISVNAPTLSGFNTSITTIMANAGLSTAIGGTPSHDSSDDKVSITLKCHDANGELYNVTLNRQKMTVTSYESDGSCVFRSRENQTVGRLDRIETLGLLGSGVYVSERVVSGTETAGRTMITGTGMVLTGAVSEGQNQTKTSSAHVGGRMNLSEWFWFGGGE